MMKNRPRVVAVKEKKIVEKAPPSEDEFEFLQTHGPKGKACCGRCQHDKGAKQCC